MQISSGVRFIADLNSNLELTIPQWIGSQRCIYNGKTTEDELFQSQRKIDAKQYPDHAVDTPIDQQYSHFKDKKLTPWLYDVPSQILRNGAVRWFTAKTRQLKKLAKAPRIRNRNNFNSVMITNELFRFIEHKKPNGKIFHEIEIGTKANPIGTLRFRPTAEYQIPKIIYLRKTGSGKWWVSFSYEKEIEEVIRSSEELAYEFNSLSDDELMSAILGLDRNVSDNCVMSSEKQSFDISEKEKERIERKEKRRKKYQKKMARQEKGSKNREKTKRILAKNYEYSTNVRENFSHQTSYTLAESPKNIFALEKLPIKNMTKRAKAKKDKASGKWLRNNRRAKSGLNKSILRSCWGSVHKFLKYKAERRNKLTVEVLAAYSSQECSECGHIHPDNRHGSKFVCKRCGFSLHADENAARNIKKRAFVLIRSKALEKKNPKKRTAFTRKIKTLGFETDNQLSLSHDKTVGNDVPEAIDILNISASMSVEPYVSHDGSFDPLCRCYEAETSNICFTDKETYAKP